MSHNIEVSVMAGHEFDFDGRRLAVTETALHETAARRCVMVKVRSGIGSANGRDQHERQNDGPLELWLGYE